MAKFTFDILSIFGKKSSKVAEQYVQEAVLPLSVLDDSLPKMVVEYVLEGTSPEVLVKLSQLDTEKAVILLDKPGTVDWWWGGNNFNTGQYNKVIRQGINARHKLYSKVGDGVSAEQVARFAKVLAAACQDINIKVLTSELPSWVSYLVGDVFSKTFDNSRDEKLEHRKHWNMELLAEIIGKETDKPANSVLYVIFDRQHLSDYHYENLNRLFVLPGFKEYLIAQQDFIKQTLIGNLSAAGQVLHLFSGN